MVTKPTATATLDRLCVELEAASYPILIGSDWLPSVAEEIRAVGADASHVMLVCDAAIRETLLPPIAQSLHAAGLRVDQCEVPSGEPSKSVEQLSRLWQWMLECRADRRSVVIAVGGGVVGDLAGFAAASYQRGIRLVQIPTTLLAQVDSSVGGKTGINLPAAKNMVGAFWQPMLVAIDTRTLETLPSREYTSGLAEVIKYGVIDRPDFFAWLEANAGGLVARDAGVLRETIRQCCQAKADVVADDQRETSGRRAILNYGHTFAHAIEATAGYGKWLHGEAVAIGMQMAMTLAVQRGMVPAETLERQQRLLEAVGLPIRWSEADPAALFAAMQSDKKNEHGRLKLILPTRIGEVRFLEGVGEQEIEAAIEACR
ncbi:3-dehydroquinate synthase [Candidatus Laterigemmans baculatus]|uniref:3-dehydroquinate synthase n=1 Tax=Candidatus Laterigemmans baculatus TaxID=2770505 RepID=UPI0013D9FC83|nr:3-dehydroquinate synthase [Candidatus Laterigemmans baculatus]